MVRSALNFAFEVLRLDGLLGGGVKIEYSHSRSRFR